MGGAQAGASTVKLLAVVIAAALLLVSLPSTSAAHGPNAPSPLIVDEEPTLQGRIDAVVDVFAEWGMDLPPIGARISDWPSVKAYVSPDDLRNFYYSDLASSFRTGFIAHELAHLWQLRHSEGMKWSAIHNNWVVEGFAEYIKDRFARDLVPRQTTEKCWRLELRFDTHESRLEWLRDTDFECDSALSTDPVGHGAAVIYAVGWIADVCPLEAQSEDYSIWSNGSGNTFRGQYSIGPVAWKFMEAQYGIDAVMRFWTTEGNVRQRVEAATGAPWREFYRAFQRFGRESDCWSLYASDPNG